MKLDELLKLLDSFVNKNSYLYIKPGRSNFMYPVIGVRVSSVSLIPGVLSVNLIAKKYTKNIIPMNIKRINDIVRSVYSSEEDKNFLVYLTISKHFKEVLYILNKYSTELCNVDGKLAYVLDASNSVFYD